MNLKSKHTLNRSKLSEILSERKRENENGKFPFKYNVAGDTYRNLFEDPSDVLKRNTPFKQAKYTDAVNIKFTDKPEQINDACIKEKSQIKSKSTESLSHQSNASKSEEEETDDYNLRLEKSLSEISKQRTPSSLRKSIRAAKDKMPEKVGVNIRPCNSCDIPNPHSIEKDIYCCCIHCASRKKEVKELWLISAPGNKSSEDTWRKLNEVTIPRNLSKNYKLHLPEFKVGTQDTLFISADKLNELDSDAETLVCNIYSLMKNLLQGDKVKKDEYLQLHYLDILTYLSRFIWERAKYPAYRPVLLLIDILRKEINDYTKVLKMKDEEYNHVRVELEECKKEESSDLMYRYLGDIIDKNDFVLDSNYLTTLLVIVPKNLSNRWLEIYGSLSEMVIPNSSKELFCYNNQKLFNVTLWKKYEKEFRKAAAKERFLIREFAFNEEDLTRRQSYIKRKKKGHLTQIGKLLRWTRISFNEVFRAWIHCKALRMFVESVLRYGLPTNFQVMILIPIKTKKLRAVLDKLYKDVDTILATGPIVEVPAGLATYLEEECYRYVFFKIELSKILGKK